MSLPKINSNNGVTKLIEKCYWCGRDATSREHVPPKCLFPEDKDIESIYKKTFRCSLITVLSCDEHNLAKSHHDEYLMVCLGGRVGNNGIAYIHTNTKIKRAIKRNSKLIQVQGEDEISILGKQFPVLFVQIDNYRLMHSFESIARALVFHEFSFCYQGRCQVIADIFFSPKDFKSTKFQAKSAQILSEERKRWGTEKKGDNPRIFTYQFSKVDAGGTFTVALTFYEKTVVYIIMSLLDDKTYEKVKEQLKSKIDQFLNGITV